MNGKIHRRLQKRYHSIFHKLNLSPGIVKNKENKQNKPSSQSNHEQPSPSSEQIPIIEASPDVEDAPEINPQDCPRCDNVNTLEYDTEVEPSADYEDIETLPSEHIITDSDISEQPTPDNSTPTPDITHIPRPPTPIDPRIISGTNNSVTTYKHKNRLHLKINIPVSQTLSSPDNSSAQYSHTSQANDDEPTTPISEDMEHNICTGNVPNHQSPESFPPAIQNNIRIMGQ